MQNEMFVLSTYGAAIATALEAYGVESTVVPNAARLQALLDGGHAPRAMYLDDTPRGIDDTAIRSIVRSASAKHVVAVVLVTQRTELSDTLVQDIQDMGGFAQVVTARTPDAVTESAVTFIAATLRLQRDMHSAAVPICVAGAKGGIGKTFLLSQIAVAMARRGARVLIVDGDLTNSGLVPEFNIPRGYIPYTSLERDTATSARFTPERLSRIIYKHPDAGVDFLLGTDEANVVADLHLREWNAMMANVMRLPYDVVLIDTGPDVKRRPYSLSTLVELNGWALIPAPPGAKEEGGLMTLMQIFESHASDLTHRCIIVLMSPEKGSHARIQPLRDFIQQRYPNAFIAGTLPRDAYLVSLAAETSLTSDRFVSPLDLGPYRALSVAVHDVVDAVAQKTNIHLPQPKPSLPWWKRVGSMVAPQRFLQSPSGSAPQGASSEVQA